MGDPLTGKVLGAEDANVTPEKRHLLRYLMDTQSVRPLDDPHAEFIFHTSAEVRQMIELGDDRWRTLVPDIVLRQGPWKELAKPAM